jgi:hypothetical protein
LVYIAGLVVVINYTSGREGFDHVGEQPVHFLCDTMAVTKNGLPSQTRILETMKDLDAGDIAHVKQVLMEAQV